MTLRVGHSSEAQHDPDAIAYLISRDSPDAAYRWLEKINRTMGLLAAHPGLGEAVDHLGLGVRRISKGSFVLYFKPRECQVELVRVIHGSHVIQQLGE